MKDAIDLRAFYQKHCRTEKLILCTLVGKQGSSYRTLGAKKIVGENASCGLLSGGCLEADIEKTARQRSQTEDVFLQAFSTLGEQDRLLGYQSGCQGVIEILFEKMAEKPLDLLIPFGSEKKADGVLISLTHASLGERQFSKALNTDGLCFFDPWIEPIQLFIIGCGPDASFYLPLAESLGFDIRFFDHRRDWIENSCLPSDKIACLPLDKIAGAISESDRTAAVLMSHNYEADMEIIKGLNGRKIGYLGCLGPADRYAQIKSDLFKLYQIEMDPDLQKKICAPAGIFARSQSPEQIALSVIAQIQERLVERNHATTWTLILAAGSSTRFGGVKALARLKGETLLKKALMTAEEFTRSRTLTVTGKHRDSLNEVLITQSSSPQETYNPNWQQGMGNSIAWGVKEIVRRDPRAQAIVILPVDQPLVETEHLHKLADICRQTDLAVFTGDKNLRGAPAAIPKRFFRSALQLSGELGMKSILKDGDFLTLQNPRALLDVDTASDLIDIEGQI